MHTPGPAFFMLRAGEVRATLDCGCSLINEVNAVFKYCPVHYAAPKLLEALEAVRPWLNMAVADDAFRHCALPLGGSKALRQAELAIAEAKGE